MGNFLKRFRGIIIFVAVEVFFYFKTNPSNLELFFMIWGFIALVLLLYNIFDVKSDGALMGMGGDSSGSKHYGYLMGRLAEDTFKTDKNRVRNGRGILDSTNLLYLFCLIVNIIGYIIVMPK